MLDDAGKQELLTRIKTIAVVGLSPKENRPSHRVAKAMQQNYYQIVPVRPAVRTILGETVYPKIADIPFPIDLVNVFRAPKFVPQIVEECITHKVPAIWLQEGVVHEAAAQKAVDAGIKVVMGVCIHKEYRRLMDTN